MLWLAIWLWVLIIILWNIVWWVDRKFFKQKKAESSSLRGKLLSKFQKKKQTKDEIVKESFAKKADQAKTKFWDGVEKVKNPIKKKSFKLKALSFKSFWQYLRHDLFSKWSGNRGIVWRFFIIVGGVAGMWLAIVGWLLWLLYKWLAFMWQPGHYIIRYLFFYTPFTSAYYWMFWWERWILIFIWISSFVWFGVSQVWDTVDKTFQQKMNKINLTLLSLLS